MPANRPITEGCVDVVESGAFLQSNRRLQVPLGDGLEVLTGLLHEVCFTEVNALSLDLSVVLGAVKCADRSIRRQHSVGWARQLNIKVPVYELGKWRDDGVVASLVDALQYLTGDIWRFQFVKRRKKHSGTYQGVLLDPPDRPRVFVPFSHGLDSFAQSELLRARSQQLDVMPVHLRSSGHEHTMKSLKRSRRDSLTPVPVSAAVSEPKHSELSFRSRPFLYDGLAAYAAVLYHGGQVMIPENGQGSLGGSLVRLGLEAPHRSCHPGFTSRLNRFFARLTGTDVTFMHPALFHTKGQVLRQLAKVKSNSDAWLAEHSSCSYDARHANRDGKQVHCGVCGNCVLRRVSIHAAGLSADPTPYKFDNLHATTLEGALAEADGSRSLAAYNDVARNAARSMQRLAQMMSPDAGYRVASEIDGLARYQQRAKGEVREALYGMLEQHSKEWTNFLDYSGKSSWLTQLARG